MTRTKSLILEISFDGGCPSDASLRDIIRRVVDREFRKKKYNCGNPTVIVRERSRIDLLTEELAQAVIQETEDRMDDKMRDHEGSDH